MSPPRFQLLPQSASSVSTDRLYMRKYDDDEEGSSYSGSWPPSKHDEDRIRACINAESRRTSPTALYYRIESSLYLLQISFRILRRRGWIYKSELRFCGQPNSRKCPQRTLKGKYRKIMGGKQLLREISSQDILQSVKLLRAISSRIDNILFLSHADTFHAFN